MTTKYCMQKSTNGLKDMAKKLDKMTKNCLSLLDPSMIMLKATLLVATLLVGKKHSHKL